MNVKVATAESFTHGIIAREINTHYDNHNSNFNLKVLNKLNVELVCGILIPTLSAINSFLNKYPSESTGISKNIESPNEKTDLELAVLMAQKIKLISAPDIGIGTSPGISCFGIAVVTNKFTIKIISDLHDDKQTYDSRFYY